MEKFDHLNARHVVVRLGERNYAVDMVSAQEIIHSPVLEPGLDGPENLTGVYESIRGAFPVIDLLGRPPDECCLNRMAVLVVEDSGELFGLLVDQILDYVEIHASDLCPVVEGANGIPGEFLKGTARINNIDYYLVDLKALKTFWNCAGVETGAVTGGRGQADRNEEK